MKNIILLAMVCTGFVVTTPFTAQALDSEKIGQNLHSREREATPTEPNMSLPQQKPLLDARIAQYNRDNQYRRNQNRERQFSVYYRNRNDRQWTLEGYHNNRRDARQAANRLERRGYRTYVQVSRRINSGMGRG